METDNFIPIPKEDPKAVTRKRSKAVLAQLPTTAGTEGHRQALRALANLNGGKPNLKLVE